MVRTISARLAFACSACGDIVQFLNVRASGTSLPWSGAYAPVEDQHGDTPVATATAVV